MLLLLFTWLLLLPNNDADLLQGTRSIPRVRFVEKLLGNDSDICSKVTGEVVKRIVAFTEDIACKRTWEQKTQQSNYDLYFFQLPEDSNDTARVLTTVSQQQVDHPTFVELEQKYLTVVNIIGAVDDTSDDQLDHIETQVGSLCGSNELHNSCINFQRPQFYSLYGTVIFERPMAFVSESLNAKVKTSEHLKMLVNSSFSSGADIAEWKPRTISPDLKLFNGETCNGTSVEHFLIRVVAQFGLVTTDEPKFRNVLHTIPDLLQAQQVSLDIFTVKVEIQDSVATVAIYVKANLTSPQTQIALPYILITLWRTFMDSLDPNTSGFEVEWADLIATETGFFITCTESSAMSNMGVPVFSLVIYLAITCLW